MPALFPLRSERTGLMLCDRDACCGGTTTAGSLHRNNVCPRAVRPPVGSSASGAYRNVGLLAGSRQGLISGCVASGSANHANRNSRGGNCPGNVSRVSHLTSAGCYGRHGAGTVRGGGHVIRISRVLPGGSGPRRNRHQTGWVGEVHRPRQDSVRWGVACNAATGNCDRANCVDTGPVRLFNEYGAGAAGNGDRYSSGLRGLSGDQGLGSD